MTSNSRSCFLHKSPKHHKKHVLDDKTTTNNTTIKLHLGHVSWAKPISKHPTACCTEGRLGGDSAVSVLGLNPLQRLQALWPHNLGYGNAPGRTCLLYAGLAVGTDLCLPLWQSPGHAKPLALRLASICLSPIPAESQGK